MATKLLLIDDDEELCEELAQVLTTEGFIVDVVFDGLQGLQCLHKKQYDIIILDLKLPGLNGYRVLKGIRETTQQVKVIVLSGRPLGEQPLFKEGGVFQNEEEKVLNMADLVINKPFAVESFLQKVKALA